MHGHVSQAEFLSDMGLFLGSYYLTLSIMNGVAALYLWQNGKTVNWCKCGPVVFTNTMLWLALCGLFIVMASLGFSGSERMMWFISLPTFVINGINLIFAGALGPVMYSGLTLAFFVGAFLLRKFFVHPAVAWIALNASLLFMGLSITDQNFASIVTKADNVPIVAMIFLLGFFTWLATKQAVANDERDKQGLEPLEKLGNEKVLVWPDLVYSELICMVALTAILILWAIVLKAPLEEPASAVKTPNPSKAPWYFLGLQEMLVYFDPWFAGVVAPLTIVGGLCAIPYLDVNKKGNGYYTIDQRKFAYLTFQFGFLVLWVTLIILGTFLRGPNWNFFGPFEPWDVHKVIPLNNIDLSQIFWVKWFGMAMPSPPEGASAMAKFGWALFRELPGILCVAAYLVLSPPLMAMTFFRKLYIQMGLIRFMVMSNMLLLMAFFPIKMVLRWSFNLKYIIALPEYLLNF
ncbi:MAG: hypothetical protein ACKVH8_04095 [Pirellulales bacterium]